MARKRSRPLRKVGAHVERIARYYQMVEAGKSRAEIAKSLRLSEFGLYAWQERMAEIGLRLPKPLPPAAISALARRPTFPLTFELSVSALPIEGAVCVA